MLQWQTRNNNVNISLCHFQTNNHKTMVNPSPVSFWTQANALFRKNLTFQKRNVKSNIRLILFPLIICVLLVLVQIMIDIELRKSKFKCGCICANNKTRCDDSEKVCGPQYSDQIQVPTCPISNPAEWPPLLQLPAVSCKQNGSCHFTTLFTADNHSFGHSINLLFKLINVSDMHIYCLDILVIQRRHNHSLG